tara:strand:- start:2573 stop:3472 length:900 start_codon:yes stop_codon:yes gene_type:complete
MISNRYKFIFIHTPKTGGTSVAKALHTDTDQECRLLMEPDGEGIASIAPNKEDFPWWTAWTKHQFEFEATVAKRNPGDRQFHLSPTDLVFSSNSNMQYCGDGNIKHLQMQMWYKLLHDRRLCWYGSFTGPYKMFSTCRNPYTREFSLFLYESRDILEEAIQTLMTARSSHKEISSHIRSLWVEWCRQNLNSRDSSQAAFCTAHPEPFEPYLPSWDIPTVNIANLIRLEHLEKDYNEFCNLVGIERKGSQIPHLLNYRSKWAEYLPDNILEWYTGEPLDLIHKYRDIDFKVLPYTIGELE